MEYPTDTADLSIIYQYMQKSNVMLSYQGALDGALIEGLIQTADKALKHSKAKLCVKRRVINILVECLQNSFHYLCEQLTSESADAIKASPFLLLSQTQEQYSIYTGNYVTDTRAEMLKERLNTLNAMETAEIKAYYLKVLGRDELAQKGGAGLGLVDIWRRARHKVSYNFEETESGYTMFSMLIQVN
jgi:hypothetical protein